MTGRSRTYGVGLLARQLKPGELVRDLLTLAVMGALAAFTILFSQRVQFDQVAFQASLDYTTVTSGQDADTPGELTVHVLAGELIRAAGPSAEPSGGSRLGDYENSLPMPTHVFPASALATVQRVYGGVITSGAATLDGAVIDEATASAFKIGIGDRVIISMATDDGMTELAVPVSGLCRPDHEPHVISHGGFLLLPDTVADRLPPAPAIASTSWLTYDPVSADDAQSRASMIRGLLAGSPQTTGFVTVITLLGLGFWTLGLLRVAAEVRRRLVEPGGTLMSLGLAPRVVRGALVLGLTGGATVGALLAATLARTVTLAWTSFYLQRLEVILVTVALVIVAVLVAVRTTRRIEDWTTTGRTR